MNVSNTVLKLESQRKKLLVAVVDDDQEAIDWLLHYITMTDGFELVFTTTNPREGLKRLQREQIDVLFLDIEMPAMNGIDFLSQLKVIKETTPSRAHLQVIMCSAYEEFALKTFDYKVADYLVKPIFFERYMEAVKEVKQRLIPLGVATLDEQNDCLMIFGERGAVVHRLNYQEILYVEACDDRTQLWTSSTDYFEIQEPFKKVATYLPKAMFVKVHRSYAISLHHFLRIDKKQIILKGTDHKIPQGKKGNYPLFESWLEENALRGRYISERTT